MAAHPAAIFADLLFIHSSFPSKPANRSPR
jgi:hypothetical protein